MSLFIDKKYINLIANHFEKFKWKSDNLANCRCKFCGDSSRHKNKARGYFFVKSNNFFYKCHNCGVGYSIYNLLQQVAPSMCKEYSTERFIAGDNRGNYVKPTQKEIYPFTMEETKVNIQYLEELPSDHKARLFVEGRKIPKAHWKNIGYAEDFSKVAEQFDESYKDKFFKEDRLIICVKSMMGMCGLQGRSFSKMNKMKYITLKKENRSCFYNYDNVDTSKTFFVLEGPIDSMFLKNSIATMGMSAFKTLDEKIDDTNAVYVVDNQPYNREVVNTIQNLIERNKKVCIFPVGMSEKDLNDMAMSGLDPQQIVENNIYSDLKAKLVFNNWKKI
jgi:hypothetical protein